MQVLRQHKISLLISFLLIITLVISIVVLAQNHPATSPEPSPSPTASPSSSPLPTGNSPSPTTTTNPTVTATLTSTPQPTTTPTLLPGEISQYQGQNLTPISLYIAILNQHPDVAIAGTQNIPQDTYKLAITGLVNNQTNYSYDEVVNNFNSTLQVATLPCVEGWSVTMLWQGIPLADILEHAGGVSSNANTLSSSWHQMGIHPLCHLIM
jgi:DMSO/TMAO reductase YedYZ molybdopterin-dependent catalytic subunit